MTKPKYVSVLKDVPVVDDNTLAIYLNNKISDEFGLALVGDRVIELIKEAGFDIQPPRVKRDRLPVSDPIM